MVKLAGIGKIALEEGAEEAKAFIEKNKNFYKEPINRVNNQVINSFEIIKKSKDIQSNIKNIRSWAHSKGWV